MKRVVIFLCAALVIPALSLHAAVWTVTVSDFQFDPVSLTILQGDTVIWNDTLGMHSVTPNCAPELFGQPVADAPWTYQFVFNVPLGAYPYHCEAHPDVMRAQITVRDRGTWHVSVQNYSFTPANITITQGDTVVWNNVQGFHDVHNTNNPSLFGNTAGSAPWTYTFIFNLPPALYNYICTIHGFQGSVNELAVPTLPAPGSLVAYRTESVDAHVQLWWNKVCNATGYSVFRSTDAGLPAFPDSLGMTADTTWTDSTSNPTGFYLVKAVTP